MASEVILLVDDEKNIIELARMYLEREGFGILTSMNGPGALEIIRRDHPDLVVLDIMLPGLDGLEICKQVRSSGDMIPIILLTARDDDIDKIVGLELGADDYLTKPFNPRELVARVKAVLRRANVSTQDNDEIIRIGSFELNIPKREVLFNGNKINLRYQEFEVLRVLAQNRDFALTRDQLLNKAWGFDFSGDTRTVDMHIAILRKKLIDTNIKIETITGVGYKLVA